MSGGRKMTSFNKYMEEQLKDDVFKKEFDDLETRYEMIKQIIKIRSELNMTQSELAQKCGILQSNISRFESGNYNPSLEFLQKIAVGLGKKLHIEFK